MGRNFHIMRDVIHGAIRLESAEMPVFLSPVLQRLREIKQLGFGEIAFPSASHNRLSHSLGAMATAQQLFNSIFQERLQDKDKQRLASITRMAALLHDIGHGPLSHSCECAMPSVQSLKIPGYNPEIKKRATHEDWSLKFILDTNLTPILEKLGQPFGFGPSEITSLLDPKLPHDPSFFQVRLKGSNTSINVKTILSQLISSEIDADRMDYLRRDSLFAGVSYGVFDFNWLSENLGLHIQDENAYLCIDQRALYALEDFLLSRNHMFLMIYFHSKSVIFDKLLQEVLEQEADRFALPSKWESYLQCTDASLLENLRSSSLPASRMIVQKNPPTKIFESLSDFPGPNQGIRVQAEDLSTLLEYEKIKNWTLRSSNSFSKYFSKAHDPIFVRFNDGIFPEQFWNLQDCTDLFKKHQSQRSITRIYVLPEEAQRARELLRSNA